MSVGRKCTAWMVHLYTAVGGLLGLAALLLAAKHATREAFFLLYLTSFVDSTDGILARKARVSKVLPGFSGAQLDDAIDVLTFIWAPVFIIGIEGLLPHPAFLAIPVIASLYAYGQVDMKTPDNYFLGFPSYWNIVALYLWWLSPGPVIAVLFVLVPGVLSFIPTRYLYPSRNAVLWKTSWALGILWALLIGYLLLQEAPGQWIILLSLYYPAYYLGLSFYLDWRIRRLVA